MIRGVRKPDEAQQLGLSRRLMVRVGALLKHGIEITPAVLEAARPGTPLENLLLDPAVLEKAAAFDAVVLAGLVAAHLKLDPQSYEAPVLAGTAAPRVICLREELEASEGWDEAEPAASPAAPSVGVALAAYAAPLASPPPQRAAGDAEPLFSKHELDRLRLKLMTAANPAERIEALRILAHAPVSGHDKADVVLLGLDDRDPQVRGEAAGLLFMLGASDDLREALQALCDPREDVRIRAGDRAVMLLNHQPKEFELGAAAVLAMATLKSEPTPRLSALLLQVLGLCAGTLVRHPQRLAELIRVVLARISAVTVAGVSTHTAASTYTPATKLIRKLCQSAPETVLPLLREERSKSTEPAIESFLLQLVIEHAPAGGPEEAETLGLCASFLTRDTSEGRESRAIGLQLIQRGASAIRPLAEAWPQGTLSAQKYILQLFEDIVRYRKPPAEAKELAAQILLRAMESGSRGLRITAMHCRYPTDPEITVGTRARVAQAFLASLSDFGFKTDIEIAEDGLARMGLPAIQPLLERLAPERPTDARIQAVRILGNLALELKPQRGEMKSTGEAVTEILRRLQALSAEENFAGLPEVLTALGKLCASPASARQADDVVRRRLMAAVGSGDRRIGLGALEGLTWLASSRRADPQLIATVSGLLRRALDEARDDLRAETREIDGEKVIEISQGEDLVEKLPVALAGISRIARAPGCPASFARELTRDLIARWKKIMNGELIWGPANSMLTVKALQEIAALPAIPDDLRLEVLKALAPRITQIPVMHAIAGILAANDTGSTAAAALSVGLNILGRRRSDGRYDAEDRPDILAALARVATRAMLGTIDAKGKAKARSFRQQVTEDLFQGATDLVPGAFDSLLKLRDAKVLPKEDQDHLERRLGEMTALAHA